MPRTKNFQWQGKEFPIPVAPALIHNHLQHKWIKVLNLCLTETASSSTQQVNVTSSKDTTAKREFRKDKFPCMDWSSIISHHRKRNMSASSRGREQKGEKAFGGLRKTHKTTVCGNKSLPWGRKQTCPLQQITLYSSFGHSARTSITKSQM